MLPLGTAYVDDGDKCEDDGPRDHGVPNDADVIRDIRDDGDSNEPKTLRMGNRVSVCLYNVFRNTSAFASNLCFRCHVVAETYEELE